MELNEMPTWFLVFEIVFPLILLGAVYYFGYGPQDQFDAIATIIVGLIAIGFLSLWLTLGENYIPEIYIHIPYIGSGQLMDAHDIHLVRYVVFLITIVEVFRCGWRIALQWAQVGSRVDVVSRNTNTTTHEVLGVMTIVNTQIEDCTQQAMQLVSSAMRHLDGQISEEVWEDIMEECMKVVHPLASYGMVSTHIMKCCKRKIPTRLQMSLMEFIASQKVFTGSGQTSGHASGQSADDAVGSTTHRSRTSGENGDDKMNEEEVCN